MSGGVNFWMSPTMRAAAQEAFAIDELEDIRLGRDVWCDEHAWRDAQDDYEEQMWRGWP